MKTWSYGINSLYKTASIDLRTGPWWVFALERTAELCCDMIPSIPLPDAKKRLRDQEDIKLNGGNTWTTRKEWYGDLSQLFHCVVHVPIFDFCQKRIKCKFIELDYDKVKKMFYQEDKRFWDEEMNL